MPLDLFQLVGNLHAAELELFAAAAGAKVIGIEGHRAIPGHEMASKQSAAKRGTPLDRKSNHGALLNVSKNIEVSQCGRLIHTRPDGNVTAVHLLAGGAGWLPVTLAVTHSGGRESGYPRLRDRETLANSYN